MPRAIVALLILATLSACSDDPTTPDPVDFTITGSVTDADGNPVPNALVLLDLPFTHTLKSALPATTVLQLTLPEPDHVRLDILSHCGTDTFSTLEMDLPAGLNRIPVESVDRVGRQLTDQVMRAIFTTSTGTDERPLSLQRNIGNDGGDYAQWNHAHIQDHVRIQAITNDDGWYTITDPCLGFGSVFPLIGENGLIIGEASIPWQVRAWAYHPDYPEGTPSSWQAINQDTGGTAFIVVGE